MEKHKIVLVGKRHSGNSSKARIATVLSAFMAISLSTQLVEPQKQTVASNDKVMPEMIYDDLRNDVIIIAAQACEDCSFSEKSNIISVEKLSGDWNKLNEFDPSGSQYVNVAYLKASDAISGSNDKINIATINTREAKILFDELSQISIDDDSLSLPQKDLVNLSNVNKKFDGSKPAVIAERQGNNNQVFFAGYSPQATERLINTAHASSIISESFVERIERQRAKNKLNNINKKLKIK